MTMPTPGRRAGLLSGASTFFGIGSAGKPASDDDMNTEKPEDKMSNGDNDPDKDEKARKAEDRRRARNKKAGRNEDDDGEDGPVDDDDSDEDETGDDVSDEEDMKKKGSRAARMRANARITAVMQHPAAKGRVNAALSMLLTTNLTRGAIIAQLPYLAKDEAPEAAAARPTLAQRNADIANISPGIAGPSKTEQEKVNDSWAKVFNRVAVSDNAGRR